MATTRMHRTLRAPRGRVYRALTDPADVARWRVPTGMTSVIHEFDVREGGSVRVSLTHDAPDRTGKTAGRTDTYRGRFVRLVPDELVVEVDAFETDDPGLDGEMTMTLRLTDGRDGTDLAVTHEGLPPGIAPADNEAGWREALDRLAALVEAEG
jgi:uncharacterized protein YndB with AHSA1/START domain